MSESQYKFFVPPGHFYSPNVDLQDAATHLSRLQEKPCATIAGIDLNIDSMDQFWRSSEASMIEGAVRIKNEGNRRYRFDNGFFDYGDALIYREMIFRNMPKRVIEVGSGFSSALLLDTIEEFKLGTQVDFIEPFPNVLLSLVDFNNEKHVKLHQNKIQEIPLSLFESLEAHDILFIDSSHVAKAGSDVCYEFLEVIPRLKPGVVVHIHDIFNNFEYPKSWVIDDNRGWNEAYLLRALLIGSNHLKIIFFNDFYRCARGEIVDKSECLFKVNPGGSIWLVVAPRSHKDE